MPCKNYFNVLLTQSRDELKRDTSQVAMGLLISITSLVLHVRLYPFAKSGDNHDQAIVLSVIALSLFSGLLLKTDTAHEDSYEMSMFSALLTTANVIATGVPPVHLAAGLYQKHSERSPTAARIRPAEPEEAAEATPRDRQSCDDLSTIVDYLQDDGSIGSDNHSGPREKKYAVQR